MPGGGWAVQYVGPNGNVYPFELLVGGALTESGRVIPLAADCQSGTVHDANEPRNFYRLVSPDEVAEMAER